MVYSVTQYTDFTVTRLTFTLLHDFMVHVYMYMYISLMPVRKLQPSLSQFL